MSKARAPTVCCLFALAACSGDRLHIVVTVPDAYAGAVVATRLSILEVADLIAFDCDDLAFGRLAALGARRNVVQQVNVAVGGQVDLIDIARDGNKLLWAEDFDVNGTVIVQGCAAVRTVGDTTVEVPGEPSTVLITPPPGELYHGTLFGPLPSDFGVQLTDAFDAPLAGAPVEWQLVSAKSVSDIASANTDDAGRALVQVPTPAHPGPQLLEVRARWQLGQTPVINGLAEPRVLFEGVFPSWNVDYAIGHFGPAGELGFATITSPGSGPPLQIEMRYFDGQSFVLSSAAVPIAVTDAADPPTSIAVVSRASGDHVVTVTRGPACAPAAVCFLDISPTGATSTRALSGVSASANDIVHFGQCDLTSGDELLVHFNNGNVGAYDALGEPITHAIMPFASAANVWIASGCAADTAGTLHRTLAANLADGTSAVAIERDSSFIAGAVNLPVAGFMPAIGTSPPLLVIGDYTISGLAISTVELRLDTGGIQPISQDSVQTIPFPAAVVGADLDDDPFGDIVALLSLSSGVPSSQAPYRQLYVLGDRYRGQKIFATSREEVWRNPALLAGDFDGDGCADILQGERLPGTGAAASRVRVQSLCD